MVVMTFGGGRERWSGWCGLAGELELGKGEGNDKSDGKGKDVARGGRKRNTFPPIAMRPR
jgi:hypothetical protein